MRSCRTCRYMRSHSLGWLSGAQSRASSDTSAPERIWLGWRASRTQHDRVNIIGSCSEYCVPSMATLVNIIGVLGIAAYGTPDDPDMAWAHTLPCAVHKLTKACSRVRSPVGSLPCNSRAHAPWTSRFSCVCRTLVFIKDVLSQLNKEFGGTVSVLEHFTSMQTYLAAKQAEKMTSFGLPAHSRSMLELCLDAESTSRQGCKLQGRTGHAPPALSGGIPCGRHGAAGCVPQYPRGTSQSSRSSGSCHASAARLQEQGS